MPVVAGTYPRLRPGRLGGAAFAQAAAVPPPQVVLWPFMIRAFGLNTSHVVVSPHFSGQAVIDKLYWGIQHASGNPLTAVQLFVASDSGGGGINLASTLIPSGRGIWTAPSVVRSDGFLPAAAGGIPFSGEQPVPWQASEATLKYPITDNDFYLKLRLVMNTAGAINLNGYIRLLVGLTPSELATFL
ncbi:MAG: hypothetical protein Q8R92_03025 [Deltaproteobacteria bacterium]|nr:hypothetical protein [Deltaproteobacteria bacterium]